MGSLTVEICAVRGKIVRAQMEVGWMVQGAMQGMTHPEVRCSGEARFAWGKPVRAMVEAL